MIVCVASYICLDCLDCSYCFDCLDWFCDAGQACLLIQFLGRVWIVCMVSIDSWICLDCFIYLYRFDCLDSFLEGLGQS